MSKKQKIKKTKKAADVTLAHEETQELEMILDRLQVQDPAGESLTNYLRSLCKSLQGRDALTTALIERLSRAPSEVGFRTFTTLKDLLEEKSYRRLVKQTAYRFAQKGFSVEPETDKKEIVLVPKEIRKSVAHVIPLSGVFQFILALIYEKDFAPMVVSVAMENSLQGPEVSVMEGSNRFYRDFIKGAEDQFSTKAYEIPIEHAARLFFEMADQFANQATGQETEQARQLFKSFYHPEKPPRIYELMPPLEDPEAHLREIRVVDLFEKVDFSPLILSQESLLPYREKIQELERPLLVVPKEVQAERARQIIEDAVEHLCVGKTRFLYQRFFEETALRFKLSGEEDLAASAWIVAQHLLSGSKLVENPVFGNIVFESLAHHWPKDFEEPEEGKDQTAGSLPSSFHRTDSGLIIPR